MARLDDLQQLEAELVALQPHACGCPHELITAASGVVQFCPPAVRRCNSACVHRPKDGDDTQLSEINHFRALIERAIDLQILDDEVGHRYCMESSEIHDMLWGIDDVANAEAEGLGVDGELDGITDFDHHWLVELTRNRQQPYVADQDTLINGLLDRVRGAIKMERAA